MSEKFIPLPEKAIDQAISEMSFNKDGLVAAIAQQYDTGEVLMMAWMNADAVRETLSTGNVCYWSRSRGKLWRKGETSGQIQSLHSMAIDCDGDSVLLKLDQTGVACHTGRRSCFYKSVTSQGLKENQKITTNPRDLYSK